MSAKRGLSTENADVRAAFLELRRGGADEATAWRKASGDPSFGEAFHEGALSLEAIQMVFAGLFVVSDAELVLGAARVPDAQGRCAVYAHQHGAQSNVDGRLAGLDAIAGRAGHDASDRVLVPYAASIADAFEAPAPFDAPEHDPSLEAGRAFWLASFLAGVDVGEEALAVAGSAADYENEVAAAKDRPHRLAYWVLRHALLRDDARYEDAAKLARAHDDVLVESALTVASGLLRQPFATRLSPKQTEILAWLRTTSRTMPHLELPPLPPDANVEVVADLATQIRGRMGDRKALVDRLFALPEGDEKTEAMRAYFEMYPIERIGAFTKSSLKSALAWLRARPDAASFAPLLPACLAGGVPDVALLLAELAPDVARQALKASSPSAWAGLVRLEGAEGDAYRRALDAFAPYEKLGVVKPKDAEAIGLAAMAIAVGKKKGDIERILPFARGEKLMGSVAREHALAVKAVLEQEGVAVG